MLRRGGTIVLKQIQTFLHIAITTQVSIIHLYHGMVDGVYFSLFWNKGEGCDLMILLEKYMLVLQTVIITHD